MGRSRILIVDDDLDYAKLLSKILEGDGHEVCYFNDIDKAYNEIHQNPKLDLILIDIMMPSRNGLELLKQLKRDQSTSRLNIVILSSSSNEKIVNEAFETGANDYILKNQDKTCLLERINHNILSPAKATECYITLYEVTDIINDFKIVNFNEKNIELLTKEELPLQSHIKLKSRGLRPYTGNIDILDCIVEDCQIEDDLIHITCRHNYKRAS